MTDKMTDLEFTTWFTLWKERCEISIVRLFVILNATHPLCVVDPEHLTHFHLK